MDWTIIEKGVRFSLCKCICGKEKLVRNYYLDTGKSKSCGCKKQEYRKESLEECKKRLLYKTKKKNDCVLWNGAVNKGGYGITSYQGKSKMTHRLIYEIHNGEIPKTLKVLHSCDHPNCINIDHLRVGNQKDNMDDMRDRNRENFLKGLDHPLSKVNNHMIDHIIFLYTIEKEKQSDIAYWMGISQNTVSKILLGDHHLLKL
jgi:hypothetical protein